MWLLFLFKAWNIYEVYTTLACEYMSSESSLFRAKYGCLLVRKAVNWPTGSIKFDLQKLCRQKTKHFRWEMHPKWAKQMASLCSWPHATHNMQLPLLPSANFNDSNEDPASRQRGRNSNIFGNICDNQRTMKAHTNETEVSPAAVDDVAWGKPFSTPPHPPQPAAR